MREVLSDIDNEAIIEEVEWGKRSKILLGKVDESSGYEYGIEIVSLPIEHWSFRGYSTKGDEWYSKTILNSNLKSYMASQWSSYLIRGLKKRVHSKVRSGIKQKISEHKWVNQKISVLTLGDTGYTPAFNEMGIGYNDELLVSLIPIGSYDPRQMLRPWHISPIDALHVHKQLKSQYSVAMHWNSFGQGAVPVYIREFIYNAGRKRGLKVTHLNAYRHFKAKEETKKVEKSKFLPSEVKIIDSESEDFIIPFHRQSFRFKGPKIPKEDSASTDIQFDENKCSIINSKGSII